METEKWLATLLVRVWTSLDLGSTFYIKRYRFAKMFQIVTCIDIYDNLVNVYANMYICGVPMIIDNRSLIENLKRCEN